MIRIKNMISEKNVVSKIRREKAFSKKKSHNQATNPEVGGTLTGDGCPRNVSLKVTWPEVPGSIPGQALCPRVFFCSASMWSLLSSDEEECFVLV